MTDAGITNEDKINIISSHIKNAQINKYNAELTLIEENAVPNPNQDNIDRATESVARAEAQITALQGQLAAFIA